MSRVALVAVSLVGLTSAMPFEGALEWMKEHGQEVMDTTEHCMEALKMAQNLKDKCGHVFDPEVLGPFATWGLLESLELVHSRLWCRSWWTPLLWSLRRSKPCRNRARERTPKLTALLWKSWLRGWFRCLWPGVPVAVMLVPCVFSLGQLCWTTASAEVYCRRGCPEPWWSLLPRVGHFCVDATTRVLRKCSTLAEMPSAAAPSARDVCNPDCAELWKIEQRKSPKCEKLLENQIKEQLEQSMGMLRELLLTAKEPEVRHAAERMPKSFSTIYGGVLVGGPHGGVVFFVCSTTSPWTGSVNRSTRPWMYRNWWMRHELDVKKKQGSAPIPISGFNRGRKKQRADAVLITFHAPWRTRSAPCMCWTPLPYFCWQQFFQGTLDGPFVKGMTLFCLGNITMHHVYIHVILLLYRLYIIGTSLHLRIKHVKHMF